MEDRKKRLTEREEKKRKGENNVVFSKIMNSSLLFIGFFYR
jgi:hypothetical protein